MTPMEIINQALSDPKLSMETAAVEMLRLTMHQHISQDKVLSPAATAACLEGLAKVKQSGGTESLKEVISAFMEGPDGE